MCILQSQRLILRPPRPTDIQSMTTWLNDYDVAKMTARVPYPYSEDDAEAFLAQSRSNDYVFVIERKADQVFIGSAGLHRSQPYELGYWLGKPFWGFGFATEATRCLMKYAFDNLSQEVVHAGWFYDNPASGRVLSKLGARHTGSAMRPSRARAASVLCHEMVLTRENFLQKLLG